MRTHMPMSRLNVFTPLKYLRLTISSPTRTADRAAVFQYRAAVASGRTGLAGLGR
jgi:hypothetical protein